ncbi:MAG: (d)CMP kinase, partial [Candidatus Chisholmbacteria bacterium]|nr:(d)CMP kinase [Candidatus Chisholmbacteria bacterium]
MKFLRIAIDGPVAAGKGTVARSLAERLGILYVDTGAMYRAAALLARREGVDWQDAEAVAALVEKAEIELRRPSGDEEDGRLTTVLANGGDVSKDIRTEEISWGSSIVSAHGPVRDVLVEKQRQIVEGQSVVMEGRDIGRNVLPEADIKFFLTAALEERARRRYLELLGRGQQVTYEEVERYVRERDERDMLREVDPLQQLPDAIVVDTTGLSIEAVVGLVESRVRELVDFSKEGQ